MNFYELIENRKTIRGYDLDRKVDKEIIDRILNAARLAPSARNQQPWMFTVANSKEALSKIFNCYDLEWIKSSSAVIIISGKREFAWNRKDGYNALETDLAIAATHIILAAEYENISACWIANFNLKNLREEFDFNDNDEIFSMISLGYKKDDKGREKIRKEFSELVKYI